MRLVVDTNIVLSALIRNGLCRKIIGSQNFEFCTLDYVVSEIEKHMDDIVERSGMQRDVVEALVALFMDNITIVADEIVRSRMVEAQNIMRSVDIRDAPVLACALAFPNDGLWTEDKHFDKQNKVKVWRTKDLLAYL